MKNWFDIIPPHEDIRQGDFDEAVFAADLGDVLTGVARPDYGDPYLFFKKTYLTKGLKNLLGRVHSKLTTGRGAGVVEIQTPFGGGKTHSLVAIYHYLTSGTQIQELLPVPATTARIAVIGGNHWNPVEGQSSEGVRRYTFWGELAYQIGGAAGYEFMRQNDEARVSPGKAKLREFLEAHQPFMLLFDEILEYINRALDVRVRDELKVSLGTQTFSFFQELSEAVSSLERGMMVVTLPRSDIEDFGERDSVPFGYEQSLARLNKIFGRVESIETPVQGEEVYAVIRRRLFDVEYLRSRQMREIVHQYYQLYQRNRNDLPPKVREVDYRNKMELAYPFHPEVIDILYEKWSTFSSFQRTRGVLRLLANVVEELYQREKNLDLILPGDINLARPAIRQEFLKHIGGEYEGIIGSDIAGLSAKAPSLDGANRDWKHLAQRVGTSIFFHSFSAGESAKGVSLPYIKLATQRQDTIPALVTDVLQKLTHALWYLNTRNEVYYFSDVPNLNRMILDKKELFSENYEGEMKRLIQSESGRQFRTYVWPEAYRMADIPDDRTLKLIILSPSDDGREIAKWLEWRHHTRREYPNTLFFALATPSAFGRLREDVKTHLALAEIKREIEHGDHPALNGKQSDLQQRMHDIERDYSYKVRRMYPELRFRDRQLDLGEPVTGNEALGNWYWRTLTSENVGAIVTELHYRLIANKFARQPVKLSIVLEQFYKNPSLPLPSEVGVVARAIQQGIGEGAFGLIEEDKPESLKWKESISLGDITFDSFLTLIPRKQAASLRAQEQTSLPKEVSTPTTHSTSKAIRASDAKEADATDTIVKTPLNAASPQPPSKPSQYHRLRLVIADIPAKKIADAHRGILMPLSQTTENLTFTLEVDVSSEAGISPSILEHKIKETIRQIGARLVIEEVQ